MLRGLRRNKIGAFPPNSIAAPSASGIDSILIEVGQFIRLKSYAIFMERNEINERLGDNWSSFGSWCNERP
jgi:hypothetical protein